MKITILNEQISKDKLYYKLDTLEVISLTLCSYLSTTETLHTYKIHFNTLINNPLAQHDHF